MSSILPTSNTPEQSTNVLYTTLLFLKLQNISKAVTEQKAAQTTTPVAKSTANLAPIQTRVTSGTSGKITDIPQERIQEYTNLFGRI
jgi:hypothetical protein